MKRIILIFSAIVSVSYAQAQNINPAGDRLVVTDDDVPMPQKQTTTHADSLFTGWCIDLNATGGVLTQNLTSNATALNYQNAVNSSISNLKFNDGVSLGLDAEAAYFFGHSTHFGVGTGIMYLYQHGNVTLDNFHVEYQSTDIFGSTFRQLITADQPVKESISISNFNIPILLKYKTKISKKIGFTADAGILINLVESNSYSTNASFDYEAIYKYVPNENGGTTAVYDNSATPAANDLLITQKQYLSTHTEPQLQNYFSTLKSEGYNVGLGINPNSNSGSVSYKVGSVGLLVRPAISFYVSDYIALNLGVFYLYQGFSNNPSSNYELTNKTGSYNSVLNSVSSSATNTYGVSFGVRFLFHKKAMPEIPVTNDADLIPVPQETAPAPPPSPAKTEEEEEPEEISVSTPILFDLNKTTIKTSSLPVLEEAVKKIDENKDVYLEINGYTDITGTPTYNIALSKKRAAVVKNYLKKKGVDPKLMKTIGHGAKSPAASNKTRAGRAKNRRVVMKLKQKGK